MQKKGLFSFLNTKTMAYMSMLIALYGCLSFLTIYITQALRFNFTFIPVAVASILFGPLAGGITGAFGDVLGWVITQTGPYFPGFTISGFVSGIIYGVFLYKKEITIRRVVFAAITMVIVVELFLNALWLSILFGNAFFVLLTERLLKIVILVPLQSVVLFYMKFFIKRLKTTPQI
jgi:ECF transporter S component (folate family)